MAVVAWRVWQRLPPDTRRSLVSAARTHGVRAAQNHGPRLASKLAKRALAKRR